MQRSPSADTSSTSSAGSQNPSLPTIRITPDVDSLVATVAALEIQRDRLEQKSSQLEGNLAGLQDTVTVLKGEEHRQQKELAHLKASVDYLGHRERTVHADVREMAKSLGELHQIDSQLRRDYAIVSRSLEDIYPAAEQLIFYGEAAKTELQRQLFHPEYPPASSNAEAGPSNMAATVVPARKRRAKGSSEEVPQAKKRRQDTN